MMWPEKTPRWRRYVRFWRHDVQADIDDELRFHFETRIEDLISLDMTAEEARAKAAEEFGDLNDVRRGLRDIGDRVARRRRGREWIAGVREDAAYAVRSLRRTPGTAVAILSTLALGLGVNAAMLTLLETIFLRSPAGIVKPMEIRRVWSARRSNDGPHYSPIFSYPQYHAAVDAVGTLARTAIYRPPGKMKVGDGEGTQDARVSVANATYFNVLGVQFDGHQQSDDSSWARRVAPLADQAARIPGVDATALTSMIPMRGFSWIDLYIGGDTVVVRPGSAPTVIGVSSGFFAAVGLHIVRGEDFPLVHGSAMPPLVVINEAMARSVWPNVDPIGECLRFRKRGGPCYRVSGVVENSRRSSIIETPNPQYYLPLDRLPAEAEGVVGPWYIAIRTAPVRAASVSGEIRALIRREFPNGIPRITRLSDNLEPQYRPWRLGATLFTTFGILALIVAAIGIYSTVSYTITQRTQEFGVRVALGAPLGDVVRLVLGEGVRTVAVGVGCGLVLALAGGRLIASLLYGIAPSDPITLAAVATTLVAIAAIAALAPAWRAARVDPVTALRAD